MVLGTRASSNVGVLTASEFVMSDHFMCDASKAKVKVDLQPLNKGFVECDAHIEFDSMGQPDAITIVIEELDADQVKQFCQPTLSVNGVFGNARVERTMETGDGFECLAPAGQLAGRSHSFAGQLAGLLHPSGELSFVELVVLVDVEVAHVLLLGRAGGDRTQRRAAEESHLDVLREAMEAEEPALALDAIEGRVPPYGLAHVGHGAHDERVEAASNVAFPARHGGDVGLHGGVAVGLRDLRVAA